VLVDGLLLHPQSLYRATTFTRSPPPADGSGSNHLGWLGWDQGTSLLLDIRNMLAPKSRLHGPALAEANQPASELEAIMLQRPR